jgi:endonuclease III
MHLGILIPLMALSILIIAIVLSSRRRDKDTRLKELRLQKEILELELKKQESKIKLLEAENKNLDKIIESDSGTL